MNKNMVSYFYYLARLSYGLAHAGTAATHIPNAAYSCDHLLTTLKRIHRSHREMVLGLTPEQLKTLRILATGQSMFIPDSELGWLNNFVGEKSFVPELVSISIDGEFALWALDTEEPSSLEYLSY